METGPGMSSGSRGGLLASHSQGCPRCSGTAQGTCTPLLLPEHQNLYFCYFAFTLGRFNSDLTSELMSLGSIVVYFCFSGTLSSLLRAAYSVKTPLVPHSKFL